MDGGDNKMYEKVIRDNVHGDIYFHEPIFFEILNTPEMQRLRRILQLGGTSLAYPGATHTRFSHSLGVYHVVSLFLEARAFEKISPTDQRLVLLAGLMHDVGHGAFSHTFEKISNRIHEQYNVAIIANIHGQIAPILKKYHVNPQDVCAVIQGTYKNKVLNLLVSSQLDADRLDYLMRDSYHCGVDYASLDIRWIVRHVSLIDHKIVFPKKAVPAIESYLLGRYHMYQQVYNHNSSVGFDSLFVIWYQRVFDLYQQNYQFHDPRIKEIFQEIFQKKIIPLEKYLQIDDYTMMDIFKIYSASNDPILRDLSQRLVNRNIFKIVSPRTISKKEIERKLVKANLDKNYYLVEVVPKRSIIYQDGIYDGKDATIWIENNDKIKPLGELSVFTQSIKKINQTNNEKIFLFPKELV
jgi:uncharacterized protein